MVPYFEVEMIYSIQILRAIAAIMVVIHHVFWKLHQNNIDGQSFSFEFGGYGVDLFFIISGFIMTYTMRGKIFSFRTFIKARVVRIIPIYWLLSLLALFVYILLPDRINTSGGTTNVAFSFLLLPTEDKYLINNGWTLTYEFYFYFIFALSFIASRAKGAQFAILSLITLSFVGFLSSPVGYYFDFLTSPFLIEFAFGCIISFLYCRLSKAFAIFVLLFGFFWIYFIPINFTDCNRVFTYGFGFFCVTLGAVALEDYIKQSSFAYFFVPIGSSSYSLYLLHPFILTAITFLFGYLDFFEYVYWYFFVMLIGSILFGHLFYLKVEIPLTRLVKEYS